MKFKKKYIFITLFVVLIGCVCSLGAWYYFKEEDVPIDYQSIENTIVKDEEPSKGSFEEYTAKYGLWEVKKVLIYKDGRKYFVIDNLLATDKVGIGGIVEVRNPTDEEIIEYSKERWQHNETKTIH